MTPHELLLQFIKYSIAGGVATVVGILLFHLFGWKLFPCLGEKDIFVKLFGVRVKEVDDSTRSRNSMISNALSFIFSNFIAYLANIWWVFEGGRHHFIVEIVFFYLVSGISVVLGTLLMGYLIRKFGLLTTYAYGANVLTAVLINFAVRKLFIFSG